MKQIYHKGDGSVEGVMAQSINFYSAPLRCRGKKYLPEGERESAQMAGQ
jgi:hypothetical protein